MQSNTALQQKALGLAQRTPASAIVNNLTKPRPVMAAGYAAQPTSATRRSPRTWLRALRFIARNGRLPCHAPPVGRDPPNIEAKDQDDDAR